MLEISSVGAKVKYAFETTAGTRPTTGYRTIPDVTEAPECEMSVEVQDCSNLIDKVTRYIDGRQDPGGDKAFTLNHTDAAITDWNAMVVEAESKLAQSKRLWFEYDFPGASKAFFWCGKPKALGSSGIKGNSVSTIPAHAVFTGGGEWLSKSTSLSASKTSETVTGTGTKTITISNAAGTATAESNNTGVVTVALAGTTLTLTGVSAGVAIVTVTDENFDEVKIVVTVTAGT